MSEYNKNSRMSKIKKYVKVHENEIIITAVSALSISGWFIASQNRKKPSELVALINSILDDNTSVVITKTKDMVDTVTIIAMENEHIDFSHVS